MTTNFQLFQLVWFWITYLMLSQSVYTQQLLFFLKWNQLVSGLNYFQREKILMKPKLV